VDTPTADPPAPALDWATAAVDDDGPARRGPRSAPQPRQRSVRDEAQAMLDAAGITAQPDLLGDELLSERQRAILDFERQWWRQPGAKEQAIRDTFEMSPTRYYQALNAVLDHPQALQYDAPLVNRLQRLRASSPRGRRLA
jgi:hypothetical protein